MTKNTSNYKEELITASNPRSPVAEAYRQLRTNIQFSSLDHPIKTLLVTSTSPEEGKSTTLANLAITMAQADRKVVLVDCDLRRPSLHEIFGISNINGLTTVVADRSISDFPFQESGVDGLRLVTSGPLPPNPSELLGSQRMAEVIEQLKTEADYVLFDTPPIIAVTDAAVLASNVDGVLLVIKSGKTKRDLARKAKALLDNVNANLLGVVLNGVPFDTSLHRYYGEDEGP
jgi:non-specific protein-tyrosine kinase